MREGFAADPFGFSALAWLRWCSVLEDAGFAVDNRVPPTGDDLNNPVLWLLHSQALTAAGLLLLESEPEFSNTPIALRGICEVQYHAVALMLIGFSLEVCLKAMLVVRNGVAGYAEEERKHHHHQLVELAALVPSLGEKDKAILRCLTQFVVWAGRYPSPGMGRVQNSEELFEASEKHEICGRDLFGLLSRIMAHTQTVINESQS